MLFATTCVDLQIIILPEVREKQISYGITYMWNLKRNDTNEQRHTDLENEHMVAQGGGKGVGKR